MSSSDNIRVVCRFRPPNKFEQQNSQDIQMKIIKNQMVELVEQTPSRPVDHKFNFDHVFDIDAQQSEVFEIVARPIIEGIFEGWNGSILAYGQTSSGKTHTMQGILINEQERGIVPRLVNEIFSFITDSPENLEFIVKLSMLEIYMEVVRDLLNPNSQKKVRIRQSPAKGVYIENLSEVCVTDEIEVQTFYNQGISNRSIRRTNMNDVSSRSHMLCLLQVIQKDVVENNIKKAKCYLIDLAGSEQVGKTGATDKALEEAKLINKSLLWLGNVINALTEGQKFVPYRNSKLTQILQETLGGNSRTTLIVTCSPAIYNLPETISSLRFGVRAKAVKNKPVINEELSKEQLIKNLTKADKKIEYLQGHLEFLKDYIKNTLKAAIPIYKGDFQKIEEEPQERRSSLKLNSIPQEALQEHLNKITELETELKIQKEGQKSVEEKLESSNQQNAVITSKFQNLLQEMNNAQSELTALREQLMKTEEINKELVQNLENLEKQENQHKESAINEEDLKTKEVLKDFIFNLNIVEKEKNLLHSYINKLQQDLEEKTNSQMKLKNISKTLLNNYQKLVESELPALEQNHLEIVAAIRDSEKKRNFLCNEKIVDVINSYIDKQNDQKKEIEILEKKKKEIQESFQKYRKQANKKVHCLKNKIELLSKCVNIAIQKYEEFKMKNIDHPHLNIEVNFEKMDEYTSNFATANPMMENINTGNKIIKMIRGKKKVDFDIGVEEQQGEEDEI